MTSGDNYEDIADLQLLLKDHEAECSVLEGEDPIRNAAVYILAVLHYTKYQD